MVSTKVLRVTSPSREKSDARPREQKNKRELLGEMNATARTHLHGLLTNLECKESRDGVFRRRPNRYLCFSEGDTRHGLPREHHCHNVTASSNNSELKSFQVTDDILENQRLSNLLLGAKGEAVTGSRRVSTASKGELGRLENGRSRCSRVRRA